MRAITTPLQYARFMLESGEGWLLFVEIPSRSVPGSFFRLVKNNRNIVAAGKTWQATSMKIDLAGETAEGSAERMTITIPNVSRIPVAYVEDADDIIDQSATVILANTGALDAENFAGSPRWVQVITEVTANEPVASFGCGRKPGVMLAPGRRYDRKAYPQLLASAGQGTVGSAY